jgi:hypothetical protein
MCLWENGADFSKCLRIVGYGLGMFADLLFSIAWGFCNSVHEKMKSNGIIEPRSHSFYDLMKNGFSTSMALKEHFISQARRQVVINSLCPSCWCCLSHWWSHEAIVHIWRNWGLQKYLLHINQENIAQSRYIPARWSHCAFFASAIWCADLFKHTVWVGAICCRSPCPP